VLHRVARPLP
jgi:hypothetical protein